MGFVRTWTPGVLMCSATASVRKSCARGTDAMFSAAVLYCR